MVEVFKEIFRSIFSFFGDSLKFLFPRLFMMARGVGNTKVIFSWLEKKVRLGLSGSFRAAVLYALFFAASFFIFTILLFDTDTLLRRIDYEVSRNTRFTIATGSLSPGLPLALKFSNLSLLDSVTNTEMRLQKFRISPAFTPLFSGKLGVRLRAETEKKGSRLDILAAVKPLSQSYYMEVDAKGFPLHEAIPMLQGSRFPVEASFQMRGSYSGKELIDETSEGILEIRLEKMVARKELAELLGGGMAEMITPESFECKITLKDSRLKTDRCFVKAKVGELELIIDSKVSARLEETLLSGVLVIRHPSGILKTILTAKQKLLKPDGSYHVPLRGSVGRPALDI